MAGETEKYLARIAQDRIPSSEEWQRRAMKILESGRAYEEQERVPSIWPGNTFSTVTVKPKPDNWLYNTLSDPKLNSGLETLAGNAADVILGRESGNALVDLGASNIPGVGAASILAAGGMPGLVDAVGAGELRNLKKIPKYTLEFVGKHFGERGLKNIDNALSKYPKAGKPSVNDALYILKTGLGGETVQAKIPYSSGDPVGDIAELTNEDRSTLLKNMSDIYRTFASSPDKDVRFYANAAKAKLNMDIEKSDVRGIYSDLTALTHIDEIEKAKDSHARSQIKQIIKDMLEKPVPLDRFVRPPTSELYEKSRRLKELTESPLQDWETIVHKQELKDARDLEKQARKQAKAAQKEADKAEQPSPVEVAPEAQETPNGGPNMWRENGWNPNVKGDAFYGKFGSNLSDESKRDMFVLDSLANHWARQIVGEGKAGKLTDADIVDALDRAEARHTRSNYNAVSQGFYDDVKKNIESGNMPGKAVVFGPKYRKNVITNRDTPTLVLDPSEKPRFYNDVRIWADEQEGPDLYEMVFRPKSDEILNSINPAYWLYRK